LFQCYNIVKPEEKEM